jgi:hypothetical protein
MAPHIYPNFTLQDRVGIIQNGIDRMRRIAIAGEVTERRSDKSPFAATLKAERLFKQSLNNRQTHRLSAHDEKCTDLKSLNGRLVGRIPDFAADGSALAAERMGKSDLSLVSPSAQGIALRVRIHRLVAATFQMECSRRFGG